MSLYGKTVRVTERGTAALLVATSLLVSACDLDNDSVAISASSTTAVSDDASDSAAQSALDDSVQGDSVQGDSVQDDTASQGVVIPPITEDVEDADTATDDANTDELNDDEADVGNTDVVDDVTDNDVERTVNAGVAEDTALYSEDGYGEVDVVRVDVVTRTTDGICTTDDQSGCTLADVLADTDSQDDFKVDIPVHYSATDFADDGLLNNAELRQRGGGARFAPQKSFRIKLDDKDELWRNERYLQLNKHPFEASRFRNKLAFDLMIDIADLPSFRTQFINLWIDDGDGPVDQGLYTHVERADDDYLERHGLADGNLYKANFFKFTSSDLDTLLIDEEGEPLDDDIFETVLEIENGKDHRNLIAMLEAVLDPEQSFDDVLARYFDEDNVLTWMAVNFLMGQQDAVRHNYFLYNPEDTETFYFLPWDYDAAFQEHLFPPDDFSADSLRARLDYGYAVGASNTFLNNYYRSGSAHSKILAKADELRADVLSDAVVGARAALLRSVSSPFAQALPDSEFNPDYSSATGTNFDEIVAANDVALHTTFGIPLPPTLLPPEFDNGSWVFAWTSAYDVSGSGVTYTLQLADSPAFSADSIILDLTNVDNGGRVDAARLGGGDLYARLIARRIDQPEVYWQVAENVLRQSGTDYYGVVRFSE